MNCFSVFYHFVQLGIKELSSLKESNEKSTVTLDRMIEQMKRLEDKNIKGGLSPSKKKFYLLQ